MFNVGGGEMIFLAILALLVFGPEGLPGVVKTVTRTVRAFKQAANEFQQEVNSALTLEHEKRQVVEARRRRVVSQQQVAQLASAEAAVLGPTATPLASPTSTSETATPTSEGTVATNEVEVPAAETGQAETTVPTPETVAATAAVVLVPETRTPLTHASVPAASLEPAEAPAAAGEPLADCQAETTPEGLLSGDDHPPEQPLYVSQDDDGPGLPMARASKPPTVTSEEIESPQEHTDMEKVR
jgi:Tat protein translocase TatB subunit